MSWYLSNIFYVYFARYHDNILGVLLFKTNSDERARLMTDFERSFTLLDPKMNNAYLRNRDFVRKSSLLFVWYLLCYEPI